MGKCTIRNYDDEGNLISKQCSKCGQVKDVSEFYKDKSKSDCLQSNCKSCDNERNKDYQKTDKRKDYMKKYRENNKEYYKEYYKEYRENNKEYREANKEYMKEYMKEYRQTPEGKAAKKRENHRRRMKVKKAGGTWTLNEWEACLKFFDNNCAYTGQPMDVVTMDHIVALNKGGTNSISNIVPADVSPNSSKHNSDIFEWYSKQPYFSWDKYLKICLWIIKNL